MAPDMNPPAGAAAFLDTLGWGDADVLPLAGDASFRRYFRVADHGRSAILMDAPPPHEDPKPFLDVAQRMAERGCRYAELGCRGAKAAMPGDRQYALVPESRCGMPPMVQSVVMAVLP